MKSITAVRLYLVSAPWFEKYRINLCKVRKGDDMTRFTEGNMAELTISGAFYWSDTREGTAFWRDINKSFISWFRS